MVEDPETHRGDRGETDPLRRLAAALSLGVADEVDDQGPDGDDRSLEVLCNDDETATTNLSDSLSSVAPADGQELLLPHNTSRALILTQKQHNGASITAGVVMVRVLYTIR